jgi:hypothetical protein
MGLLLLSRLKYGGSALYFSFKVRPFIGLPMAIKSPIRMWRGIMHHVSRGSIIINIADLNLLNFVDLQILSSREVDSGCCDFLNSIRVSIIVVFVTNIILLSIMPFGLYRLCCDVGGALQTAQNVKWYVSERSVLWEASCGTR